MNESDTDDLKWIFNVENKSSVSKKERNNFLLKQYLFLFKESNYNKSS